MHGMVLDHFSLDRLEGAEPDMQGQVVELVTALAHAVNNLLGEVQTGGWRCHSKRLLLICVDCLVALVVEVILIQVTAMDIGRQGHDADRVGKRHQVGMLMQFEPDAHGPFIILLKDLSSEIVRARKRAANGQPFAGLEQTPPFCSGIIASWMQQQAFDLAAA